MVLKHKQVAVRGADPGFNNQVGYVIYFIFQPSFFLLFNQRYPFKHVFSVSRVMLIQQFACLFNHFVYLFIYFFISFYIYNQIVALREYWNLVITIIIIIINNNNNDNNKKGNMFKYLISGIQPVGSV